MVFLALEDSTGIGFTQLYPFFSSVSARRLWILYDLFVMPEVRGRSVGRALLEEAQRFAAGTGAARLVLATTPDNVAAQRLYESAGWKRDVFLHYYLTL